MAKYKKGSRCKLTDSSIEGSVLGVSGTEIWISIDGQDLSTLVDINQITPIDNIGQAQVKQDNGKLRYDLMPFDALDDVAEILTYGINKYPKPEENWRVNSKPEDIKRYRAAMLRHLSEVMQGRDYDDESGLKHMAHIATNALFILALEKGFKDAV